METLFSLMPMFIMQSIYAVFVFQIAKRTEKNAPLFTVATLIPLLGAFFVIYVFWSTTLYLLDSVNELRDRTVSTN